MDAQIAKRLAMALAAKSINMKQAGLAAGLNPNYVRDAVRRGRGKFELLERVAEANGLSWIWLKTGEVKWRRRTPPLNLVRGSNILRGRPAILSNLSK